MANSAFDFNQAPNTKGRQFTGLGAIGKAIGLGSKSSGSGISAKDQSALLRQKLAHDIDSKLVGHILGEVSAKSEHNRGMSKNRQTNKLSQSAADAAHARTLADREHAVGLSQSNTPENHIASAMSFPGGSVKYSETPKSNPVAGPQFGGTSGDTSGQSATFLG